MKVLKEEKEKLEIQKNAQYDTYQYFKNYQQALRTVCKNVEAIFGNTLLRKPELEKSRNR